MKTEKELAKRVVEWLISQHWEVYQEVRFSRYIGSPIADIVAVRNNYIWIIETKKSMSLDVMEQASRWKSHFRSVAVPDIKGKGRARKRDKRYLLAKDYFKVGTLIISAFNILEKQSPPLMREYHRYAKEMMRGLCDEQKSGEYASAGGKGGGYYTPYQRTMNIVKKYIREHPGCNLKSIIDNIGKAHYYSNQSAKTSIRMALSNWEHWCKVINGKYYMKENE